ncbi:hypothetical protein PMIN01_07226 [Paraphaeosphaeria minitans]|uniref:Uncharacterized protein n=1 Tax=Paraphaeosphaeria minitans TaxID=565426 RepID=A0A9P6GFV8_9PLEO|nr:hypothetical protein PMIN01_07226 [Paraphaeosphaeria minitans]
MNRFLSSLPSSKYTSSFYLTFRSSSRLPTYTIIKTSRQFALLALLSGHYRLH